MMREATMKVSPGTGMMILTEKVMNIFMIRSPRHMNTNHGHNLANSVLLMIHKKEMKAHMKLRNKVRTWNSRRLSIQNKMSSHRRSSLMLRWELRSNSQRTRAWMKNDLSVSRMISNQSGRKTMN
mmetsp:Transcript_27043/g.88421  ORF Transcript_27043/g.88421 Transcript_27043/m.88421 type:complete len:125 (-) Transcript_27043:182-556(-)